MAPVRCRGAPKGRKARRVKSKGWGREMVARSGDSFRIPLRSSHLTLHGYSSDHARPHPSPLHLAPPPRGRGRRRLPLPGARRGRGDPERGRDLPEAGEVEDRHVEIWREAPRRERPRGRDPAGRRGGTPAGLAGPPGGQRGRCFRCCSRRRAGRSRATSTSTAIRTDGAEGPTALRLARESKEHAETAGLAERTNRASRGTRPGPAGSSGTWSTGSTTG